MNFITRDSKETQKLAKMLAKEISASKIARQNAFVIALVGDLGSGKTTFTQGFVKGFGIKEKITSPTFVLMHKHRIGELSKVKGQRSNVFKYLYHFDCYRLGKPEEILTLDFAEIIKNPKNIVLIEWADKIKKLLPENALKIKFEWLDENRRKLAVDNK